MNRQRQSGWLRAALLLSLGLSLGLSFGLCAALPQQALPDCRLDQARWLGSHNSFKPVLPSAYYQSVARRIAAALPEHQQAAALQKLQALQYGHASLTAQLQQGLRLLELDFLQDRHGGAYARPLFAAELKQALVDAGQSAAATGYLSPALVQPGFKVMHLPDIDFASSCLDARDCLLQLRQWSEAHPGHWPVLVLVNVREQGAQAFLTPGLPGAPVDGWQAADYQALEQLWMSVLGRERLFTPDDLRVLASGNTDVQKSPQSLAASVRQHGWPTVAQLAGRFLLLFDGTPAQLERYRTGHPSLAGRLMFGNYPIGADEAAMLVLNDPVRQQSDIAAALAQGLLVRTRSDDGNQQEPSRFQAALHSGAQFISSDFYQGAPQPAAATGQFRLPADHAHATPFTAALCDTGEQF